jgi:hypothetical protein
MEKKMQNVKRKELFSLMWLADCGIGRVNPDILTEYAMTCVERDMQMSLVNYNTYGATQAYFNEMSNLLDRRH